MFDKNEFSILLRSLENYKCCIMMSCICCDAVDNRAEYAKTKYCLEYCSICKDLEKIDFLISKIQEELK
jgi:hypothetical protein